MQHLLNRHYHTIKNEKSNSAMENLQFLDRKRQKGGGTSERGTALGNRGTLAARGRNTVLKKGFGTGPKFYRRCIRTCF